MPLLWLGFCFTSGIIFSAINPSLPIPWISLAAVSLAIAFSEIKFIPIESHFLRSEKLFCLPLGLLLAAFFLGGWRLQAAFPNFTPGDLAFYQPADDVTVVGTIISYPEISSASSRAILQAEEIKKDGGDLLVHGKFELRLPPGFHLSYGDQLLLRGKLKPVLADDDPPFSSYLARRSIFSRMAYPQIETLSQGGGGPLMVFIYQIRSSAYLFLRDNLPFQEASLLSGILLGIDWTIPQFLREAYRATGTIHIIAISGFNITLITWQIIRLFRRFFRPAWASLIAIAAIIFYTVMVGADSAVVRAAVMGSLAIPAYFFGRRIIGIHSLVIAASFMLIQNPFLIWDIGFQLSFLATLGLMVIADPLIESVTAFTGRKWGEERASQLQPLAVLLVSTISAQFAVSPVLFSLDSAIHLYSLPANLLILPLQPLLMSLSGIAVLLGLLVPSLGAALLKLAWPIAVFCNQIAIRIGLLPNALLVSPESSQIISLGLVLIALITASILQIRQISRPEPDH